MKTAEYWRKSFAHNLYFAKQCRARGLTLARCGHQELANLQFAQMRTYAVATISLTCSSRGNGLPCVAASEAREALILPANTP